MPVESIESIAICYGTVRSVGSLRSLSCAWGKQNSGICGAASDQLGKEIPGPHLLSVSILNDRSQENDLTKLTKISDLVENYTWQIYDNRTSLPFWNTFAYSYSVCRIRKIWKVKGSASPSPVQIPIPSYPHSVTSSGVNGGLDGCKWGLCGCSFGRSTSGAWCGELYTCETLWNNVQ